MSIAQTIRPHLPYLRRFARTLTGAQETGDAYVATLLESLVSTPSDFPKDVPARVVVSEYVDVAHAFVEGDETGMVNAVLDQIARQFRGSEFTR